MYRTAVRRLLAGAASNWRLRSSDYRPTIVTSSSAPRFCTSVNTQSLTGQSANPNQAPTTSSPSSSTTSSTEAGEGPPRHEERRKPRVEFQEEQGRVLSASLRHVPRLGWTEEAMMAGARDVGVSPSIVGSFPRKEAALVEFFMDECLRLLIDRIDSGLDLQSMIPSERISKLIRTRLEMQIPYISKWPQALSIQAHPLNVPTSFKQRAMLIDEIWHAVGDEASDIDWYVKRTVLGGIYSTTEIYMLTDDSPDHRDTWAFLEERVKDAFDLKKTIQEAKYFAQDIGAGVGKSVQGLMNGVFETMSKRDKPPF
ncbi:PREDICTED: ubiquinone biosynthesis protein COQ9, mitochondrial [Tarenaya hassleriana]|uniref:ubiquinone biosynthesis protein COQ9, mitochondrial n=1 Tax=Tarenaya hassleriana TaxID=28532 RepID=UPI00053C9B7C|nr:PREDICTED: ubiquinone biosynthesis protein COQ9, mitochondrial [Tarenaya hassleriana]